MSTVYHNPSRYVISIHVRVIFSLFIINLFQKEIFLSRSRNTSGDGKNNHKTKNKWMMAIKHLKNKQVCVHCVQVSNIHSMVNIF